LKIQLADWLKFFKSLHPHRKKAAIGFFLVLVEAIKKGEKRKKKKEEGKKKKKRRRGKVITLSKLNQY
jgi:hypothetical protein